MDIQLIILLTYYTSILLISILCILETYKEGNLTIGGFLTMLICIFTPIVNTIFLIIYIIEVIKDSGINLDTTLWKRNKE